MAVGTSKALGRGVFLNSGQSGEDAVAVIMRGLAVLQEGCCHPLVVVCAKVKVQKVFLKYDL